MSAISTGRFSTSDQSLAKWTQPAVPLVAVVIMILAACLLPSTLRPCAANRRALIKDQQVKACSGATRDLAGAGTWYWWTTNLHWLDACGM